MIFNRILLFENPKHLTKPTPKMCQKADRFLKTTYEPLRLHNQFHDFMAMITNDFSSETFHPTKLLEDITNAIPYLQTNSTVLALFLNDFVEITLYQEPHTIHGSIPVDLALLETTKMFTPGLCMADIYGLLHVIDNDDETDTERFVPMHVLADTHHYFGFMDAYAYDRVKEDISEVEDFLSLYFPEYDNQPYQSSYALLIHPDSILHLFIKKAPPTF